MDLFISCNFLCAIGLSVAVTRCRETIDIKTPLFLVCKQLRQKHREEKKGEKKRKKPNNKKPTQTFGQKVFCFSFLFFSFFFLDIENSHGPTGTANTASRNSDFTACTHQQSIIYNTDVSSFCALTLKFLFRVLKY